MDRTQAINSGMITPRANEDNYLNGLTRLFDELGSQKFFGELEIKLERGIISHIWKSESLKPEAIGLNRSKNESTHQY